MSFLTIKRLFLASEGSHLRVIRFFLQFGSWWQEVAGYYDGRDAITVFAFHDAGYDVLPSEERQVFEKLDASGQKSYVRDFTGKLCL